MKRLTVWIVSTAAGVVLLFSYSTSTSGSVGGKVVAGVAPVGVVDEAPTVDPTAAPAPAASRSASPTRTVVAPTRRVNGIAVDTRYGPVQVQIKVRGSRIISANALVYPTGNRRDQEISSWAVPALDSEVLQAQSAQVDTVSGASYTSDGYRQSLQSALDAAHL